MPQKLDKIFNPRTIAVIGASNRPHTIGYALVNNLIGKGYPGTVYPVNLNEYSIQGVRCYSQVGDISDPVDLAIIAIPAPGVAEVVRQCGEAGVGGAVVISAGFTERGSEGQALSEDILCAARPYGFEGKGKVPLYHFPESAVDVFLKMYQYTKNIELLYETPSTIPAEFSPDVELARCLLDRAIQAGREQLTEIEAKELLRLYNMPVTQSQLAKSPAEAIHLANEIGYPVVLKIVSPDIGLKTDIGGVELDIRSNKAVEEAFAAINRRVMEKCPRAHIFGITVEPMIHKRYELLIGAKKDPIFGPVIVFGMGGVAVEVFRDWNIGLPPLNMTLALRIIEGTRVYKLLRGYRGIPQADIRAIQFTLYKFAYLVMDCPQIREIDINPFVVDENGGIVLDAYVILDREFQPVRERPYSHLVISPYPKQYVRPFTLANGQPALLRPIRPEDEPLEAEMIASFSQQTRYFRFFGAMSAAASKELLKRSTQIDYDREIAIIAEVEERGRKKMAGEARLLADADNEAAEFAIVVADPWQKQGLGGKLTDYIIEVAAERGIRRIYASVLKANRVMVHMFSQRGFQLRSEDLTTYYAELEVDCR